MTLEAIVLVSLGRHPVSLRPRLPDLEARAISLAVRAGARLTAVHAGTDASVARSCLGLGAARAVLIETPPLADPLPGLMAWLAAHRCDLLLAGERAETGEGSGMVPFLVAEQLGCALVARAVALAQDGARLRVTQTLPGGRRRILDAAAPLVAIVDRSAPAAPLAAIGPAWRGQVAREAAADGGPDAFHTWPQRPGRKRPRRLAALGAGGGEREARRELAGADPIAAADAILDFLERESLLNPHAVSPRRG